MNLKDIVILVVVAMMVVFPVVVMRNERIPAEILSPVSVPALPKSNAVVPSAVFGASDFSPITIGYPETPSAPARVSAEAVSSPGPEDVTTPSEETPVEGPSLAPPEEGSFGAERQRASGTTGGVERQASPRSVPSQGIVFTSEEVSPADDPPAPSQNNMYGGSSVVKLRQSGGGYALKASTDPSSTETENQIQFETNSGTPADAPSSGAE